MVSNEIDNSESVLDVRDIIARVEEMEDDRDSVEEQDEWDHRNGDELVMLRGVLEDLKGYGGDHDWRGDWYPVTLIRDSYFRDYAEELADDIGAIDSKASWPNNCIDWDRAARELQMDYSTVEFDGVTYWYR